MSDLLSFQYENGKLEKTWILSLPAGWSCPGAFECLAKADRLTGKITDGEHQRERCYAASQEIYPNVRESRWSNFELLKGLGSAEKMAELLMASLDAREMRRGIPDVVRIDGSGDVFNRAYLDAWSIVARERPATEIYGYTKSFHILPHKAELPFALVVSEGSRWPISMARDKGYSVAHIVWSEAEAESKGLPIDHDDTHARAADHDFALLLHGGQKKGSEAAAALRVLKAEAKARGEAHGYSRAKRIAA